MAVVELIESRQIKLTSDGQQLTAVFKCTRDEWDAADPDLPYVGRVWATSRGDLWCTEITVKGLPGAKTDGSGPLVVTAVFSTEGSETRRRRANQAASWQESGSVHLEQEVIDSYIDTVSDTRKKWATVWTDAGEDADEQPDLVRYRPKAEWNITAYGSRMYMDRILSYVGKVNTDLFCQLYSAKRAAASSQYDADTAAVSDVGVWMLMGVTWRPAKAGVYEYNMHFVANNDGWNTYEGVSLNLYETAAFMDMFDGMDLNEPEEDAGLYG